MLCLVKSWKIGCVYKTLFANQVTYVCILSYTNNYPTVEQKQEIHKKIHVWNSHIHTYVQDKIFTLPYSMHKGYFQLCMYV